MRWRGSGVNVSCFDASLSALTMSALGLSAAGENLAGAGRPG
jgi:hypothetical protein